MAWSERLWQSLRFEYVGQGGLAEQAEQQARKALRQVSRLCHEDLLTALEQRRIKMTVHDSWLRADSNITISTLSSETTWLHEILHNVESELVVGGQLGQQPLVPVGSVWRDVRSKDMTVTQRLSSLTGNRAYGADEVAVVDDWSHAYVGKIYPYSRSSEVVSMGADQMHDLWGSPSESDRKQVAFVLSILQGRYRLPK